MRFLSKTVDIHGLAEMLSLSSLGLPRSAYTAVAASAEVEWGALEGWPVRLQAMGPVMPKFPLCVFMCHEIVLFSHNHFKNVKTMARPHLAMVVGKLILTLVWRLWFAGSDSW